MVTDLKITKESKINLPNPLTNLQIALPSWSSFVKKKKKARTGLILLFWTMSLLYLLTPTADPENCTVYTKVGTSGFVHYCTIGDNKWKLLFSYLWGVDDLTKYRELLYAVQLNGSLLAMETYPCIIDICRKNIHDWSVKALYCGIGIRWIIAY